MIVLIIIILIVIAVTGTILYLTVFKTESNSIISNNESSTPQQDDSTQESQQQIESTSTYIAQQTATPTYIAQQTATPTYIAQQTVTSAEDLTTREDICSNQLENYCTAYQAIQDDNGETIQVVSSGITATQTINNSDYVATNDSECENLVFDEGMINLDAVREIYGYENNNYTKGVYYCPGVCEIREEQEMENHCCGYLDGTFACANISESSCDDKSGFKWCPLVIAETDEENACSISTSSMECCVVDPTLKLCQGGYTESSCSDKEGWVWCPNVV